MNKRIIVDIEAQLMNVTQRVEGYSLYLGNEQKKDIQITVPATLTGSARPPVGNYALTVFVKRAGTDVALASKDLDVDLVPDDK
jgi:hypothetical protein